jgi:predicted ester cyclase
MPDMRQSTLLRGLEAAIGMGNVDLAQVFTDDVVGWSPTLAVSSRAELEKEFAGRENALSNISVALVSCDVIGPRAIAEWRLSADHTGPLTIDDEVLPPTGNRVVLAGATFAEFRGDKISSFRHYFDDAALLEQMLDLV